MLESSSTSRRLVEIDQAKSMQDVDDVGSVFGSTRMIFDTRIPTLLPMKIMIPEFKRKIQVARRIASKDKSPDVDRKTDCIHDLRLRQDQFAPYRVGQRQSQEVRSDFMKN